MWTLREGKGNRCLEAPNLPFRPALPGCNAGRRPPRFVTPLRMFARHRFAVMGVREETSGVVSVYVSGRDLDKTRAEPGQFFRWRS